MAEFDEEIKTGVFGEVPFGEESQGENIVENAETISAGTIRNEQLPAKPSFWQKFKSFWLQEIDWNKEIRVELTPGQQKVEDDINNFLHQEITWEKIHDFLFQEVKFGKRN